MDIQARLEQSYYEKLADIDAGHGVTLVRDTRSGKICVKKELTTYNRLVYDQLMIEPVANILEILNLYEEDGTLTVIEEFVQGQSLQSLIDQGKVFTVEETIPIVLELLDILQKLQSFAPPIIHRDIKPANVLISDDDVIKLVDFNAAKQYDSAASDDTVHIGTQGYAAPEQYGFGASGVSTDIYGIGMLINTMLTGKVSCTEITDSRFGPIVSRCLQMDPTRRYQSATELEYAIRVVFKMGPDPDDLDASGKRLYGSDEYDNILRRNMSRKDYETATGWRRFLPPGFRTLNPFKMGLAIIGYALIFSVGAEYSSELTNTIGIIGDKLFVIATLLMMVLYPANYLDIQRFTPKIKKIANPFLKVCALTGMDTAILLIGATLNVIFDYLFL